MKKEETIKRYGEDAYARQLEQNRAYYKAHKEEIKARTKEYKEEHPEEVKANNREIGRKGCSRYAKHLIDSQTGLTGEKNKIRAKHRKQYKPYKQIIAPDSQIHHEWIPDTSEYRGVALVEAEQHMHGIVDVIEIFDGEITLRTEEDVRRG